jgi:hypothetical protein
MVVEPSWQERQSIEGLVAGRVVFEPPIYHVAFSMFAPEV